MSKALADRLHFANRDKGKDKMEVQDTASNTTQYKIPFSVAVKRFVTTFSSKGRTSRSEFWWALLFAVVVDTGIDAVFPDALISKCVSLALFVMTIFLWWRRVQDIGKDGWWCLIPGYNLYLAAQPSEMTENKFGKIPNAIPVEEDLLWKKIVLGIVGFAGILIFIGVIFCGDEEEGVTMDDIDNAYIAQYCHEIEMHLAPVVGKDKAKAYISFMCELDLNEAQWRDICTQFLISVEEDKANSGLEVNAVMRFCRDLDQTKYRMSPEGKAEAAKKAAEEREAAEKRAVEAEKDRLKSGYKEAVKYLCADWHRYANADAFCDLVEGLKISQQSMIDLGDAARNVVQAASKMEENADKFVESTIMKLSSNAADEQVKAIIGELNEEKEYYIQGHKLYCSFQKFGNDAWFRSRPIIKTLNREQFKVINKKLNELVFGETELSDRKVKKIVEQFMKIKTQKDADSFIEFVNCVE